MTPLVSVVLAAHNGAKHLAVQVDSILQQTYTPLELIISDDASTDHTREVLKAYENDPRVRVYYHAHNLGLTENFMFAAHQAKGQFIAFSDQDDVWLPNKIAALHAAIGKHPLVYSDSLLIDEQGHSMHKKLSDLKKMYSGDDSRGYILYSCVWGHGMMITRSLLAGVSPVPAGVHHDIWIAYNAFQLGGIKFHDEVLTHYRQHASSTSQTLPEKNSVRKNDTRAEAFLKKLDWIRIMQQYERPEWQPFYTKLVELYARKQKGGYVWPLVMFMLRHRSAIFMYSKKGWLSQVIEILKQGRGE